MPALENPVALLETMMVQAVESPCETAVVKKAGRPNRLSNRLLASGISVCAAWLGLAMGSVATSELLWNWLIGSGCGL